MHLKIQRSQRSGGMLGGKVIFILDARADLTDEEAANVRKYKLGSTVIYNSEKSKKHLESGSYALASDTAGGMLKAAAQLALAKMALNITIDGLTKGQHVECKDLDELLGAEEAIMEACKFLNTFLSAAATFDGREEIFEFKPPDFIPTPVIS